MSTRDWELSGGLDPFVEPDTDDDRFLCSCGHPQCWLLGNDASNVLIDGKWYAADCAGLCWNCGTVDSLHNLFPVGGGRLVHDGCPTQGMAADRERSARLDEARDDFNERRR